MMVTTEEIRADSNDFVHLKLSAKNVAKMDLLRSA